MNDKIDFVKVVDPRIDFSQDSIYTIPESASQLLYRQFPATTFSNNNINIPVPLDRSYGVSSKMYMNVGFRLTITGVPTAGSRLVQIGQDAPRFMPLTSVTQTCEVLLGDQTFTQKLNWYHDALMRYNNNWAELSQDLSTFPSMFDDDAILKYGSAMNALARIGEAGPGIEPRGGFPYNIVSGNGVDEQIAVVEFRTYEPILMSPLNWGHSNQKSFRNITQLSINYTFATDLSRVWSRSYAGQATNVIIRAEIIGSSVPISPGVDSRPPILEIITMTPKSFQVINPYQRYASGEITPYVQNAATLAPGATTEVAVNNVTISGIPSRIYIFARRRDNDRTFNTTDTYAAINSISMTFGNDSGIFNQCSPQQLYAISAQNGYVGSFSDWYRYSGSVFCMDFSKDVPIKDEWASGVMENIQFQYNISLTNIAEADIYNPAANQDISYSIYSIVVYDGLVTIDPDGQVRRERNILTKLMVNDAKSAQLLPYSTVDTFAVGGGSFGSKLKMISANAKKLARKGLSIYDNMPPMLKSALSAGLDIASPQLAELVKDLGPTAEAALRQYAGQGYTENQIYKKLLKLRGAKGGKRVTKASLKRLAY